MMALGFLFLVVFGFGCFIASTTTVSKHFEQIVVIGFWIGVALVILSIAVFLWRTMP